MHLTSDEEQWLGAYRAALQDRHPGVVCRMLVYGSKARGDDTPDSDSDVLLIVKDETAHLKRELRRLGHLLAAASEAVPSIMAYTDMEWEQRKASGSPFRQAVEREGWQFCESYTGAR